MPTLLELVPSECLAALIATSTTHRSQIHSYVTSIKISNPTHASDLISSTWPRLVKWTLVNQDNIKIHVTCDMTVAAASVLVKANMLREWHLFLEGCQLSAAAAAEIAKGDWLSLTGLYLRHTKLTRAVVHEVVAANWPALSVLFIDMPVDMGILSLLFQARWPKLAFLSLYTERLPSTQKGMEQESLIVSALSNGWSKMVSYLEQTSSSSSATSANRLQTDPCVPAMILWRTKVLLKT